MTAPDDILCLSSIDWDFIWQGHQEIMSSFAKHGHRVLFIENTGVRAPTLRDLPRLRHRLRNWLRSTKGFRQERERLSIYSPLILPFPYARIARWINRTLLLRALSRWIRTTGFRPSIAWTFLPTPLARDVLNELHPEITIYYCIDDLASSSMAARRIRRSESQLFQEADLVFVTSEKLRERASRLNPRVYRFPFGVDFDAFEAIRTSGDEVPGELQALRRPVVGYVGGIHQWVDQALLDRVVRQLPDVHFVFVGPWQTDVSRLARHRNVSLLGARPHAALPRYIKGFDIGIVPYQLTDYTAHVYPTKLNEYLAMGIPVVATDLPEIRRFNAEYGPVVAVARDADGFVTLLNEALRHPSPDARDERIAVARQNSWQIRIAQMSRHIEDALRARRQAGESWEQRLRRAYQLTRRRVLRIATTIVLAYLVVFRSPVVWWLAEPLRLAEPARPAEAIVVFAGGVGESGKVGEGYQERTHYAVELFQAGHAPRILFVSGYVSIFQEADVMRELAVAHGVPREAILLETTAAGTYEQVMQVRQRLEEHRWRTILLISSPYHMRRAVWTFRHAAPTTTVIPTPVPKSGFYAHPQGGATLGQLHGILHEYVSLAYYWWKGWL